MKSGNQKPVVLILDDDGFALAKFNQALRSYGFNSSGVQTLDDARKFLQSRHTDLVLTDIHLTDNDDRSGLILLEELKSNYPRIIRLAMTKDPKVEIAEKAKALGALMCLRKPFAPGEQELVIHVKRAFEIDGMIRSRENQNPLQKAFLGKHPEGMVLTEALRKKINTAIKEQSIPISIEGETGTGKEQIVKYIHSQINKNGDVPLVSINLKGELAAATLFGYKKGAFTGAAEASIGAMGQANNGILFLDEFHRLSADVQEQILRTVQDGSYQRLGDSTELYSRFRLIIATPKSLEQCALDGEILMDLRFRLYGIEIRIPPLRERLDQLPDFIECFIAHADRRIEISKEEREKLIRKCSAFHWQGNIRQLFGVLQMLVIHAHANNEAIRADDLPIYPTMLPPAHQKSDFSPSTEQGPGEMVQLLKEYLDQPGAYEGFMNTFERMLLTRLMSRYPSVKSLCESVSLPRSTFDGKRRKLGISHKERDGP
jgi:DNA-binding NtrC family response regulator